MRSGHLDKELVQQPGKEGLPEELMPGAEPRDSK